MEIVTIPPIAKIQITFPFDELLAIKNAIIAVVAGTQTDEQQAIYDSLMNQLAELTPDG